ncbi:non-homologous end-joining DNA ligase [Burkholderia vietnamiensis]|uniref:non-homologous end-joining DNA ligase n=1 Tax=Burkholderia vietnamiensis TaxID=60552 RepID=UPI00264EEEED|nr:non-homologous end-joining DNA ligase [Burkholderia vietnamiensis]MDN8114911.1 non-homologous end-joining DNA ligase [Burkholderia vietnamiensis]
MPAFIEPALAVLTSSPPSAGTWSYEIKYDGYRMLARIDAGDVRLFTRNGHDWTDRLPHLRAALERLPVNRAWLDAEAVWFNAQGRPSFNGLQNAFDRRRTAGISLVVFDLMWLDDADLRPLPWRDRRTALSAIVGDILGPAVRFSEAIDAAPDAMLASACELGLEGIIGKQIDAPYRSGRSDRWIKLKCTQRQEFVIGGFSRRKGATAGVRAVLLGVYDEHGQLRYAGDVAPRFTPRQAREFEARLATLVRKRPPFARAPEPEPDREFHWLKPELLAEVAFLEWTPGGQLRHPSFRGLRADKPAQTVTRENPREPHGAAAPRRKRGPR